MDEMNHKKLKNVEDRLYSNAFKEDKIRINQFGEKDTKFNEEWEDRDSQEKMKNRKKVNTVKKLLIVSALFFIGAFGYAAFKFSNGGNIVSTDDVNIIFNGPVSIGGGEQFDFEVDVVNNSLVKIDSANLFIEYPSGAYSSFESQDELTRVKMELGEIASLRNVLKTFPMVLFGKENTEKEILVTLEFRFQDSNATLEKTEAYVVKIASSPVNLSLSIPKEANLNQEFEIVVDLESNSNNVMPRLVGEVRYPFGFEFKSATPPPSFSDNIWVIGDLPPSNKRTIKIRGMMKGQEGDEKEFTVSIGKGDNKNIIGTVYNTIFEATTISKPFIGVNMLINGTNINEFISNGEDVVRIDVLWKSNISTRVIDGRIEVKLDGDIIDKFSVSASSGGFYRSIDNTIVWDKTRNDNLSVIDPGESGSISFSLKSLPLVSGSGKIFVDPQIKIKAIASGKRVSDLNVPEEVTSFLDKTIKIESGLALTSRAVYYQGPFKNTGLMPPKAEKETTYTVIWTVTNSSNKISSASVSMVLPPYIRWIGTVSPESESMSFNEEGGEVIWNIGNIERGAGVNTSSRQVAFQIGFLPSISQVNSSPLLTGTATISGEDAFTGTIIKKSVRALSTRLTSDPSFSETEAQVSF